MSFFIVLACVLLSPCSCVPVEESVVSVYTTLPTTAGTAPSLDVYHQIANNIAERITSPIYRFLGYNSSTPAPEATTKKNFLNIEFLDDDKTIAKKPGDKPVDNDISQRDVEELSVESLTKKEKKPEKFTLYSSLAQSYLPAKIETAEKNETKKSIDDFDSLELDDVEPEAKPREGPLIYIMEFFGSIIQLLWGGFMALFKPAAGSS